MYHYPGGRDLHQRSTVATGACRSDIHDGRAAVRTVAAAVDTVGKRPATRRTQPELAV